MAVPTIFAGDRQHRSYQEVLEDYGKITRIAITSNGEWGSQRYGTMSLKWNTLTISDGTLNLSGESH
ncbi:hypothetical protein ACXM1Q_009175 [Streptococcus sp. 10F2]